MSTSNDTVIIYVPNAEDFTENKIKVVIIWLKCCYIMTMMVLGIIAYYKKYRKIGYEILVFAFFIIEMICLLIFDNGKKYILMLFYMMLASNFATLAMFTMLVYKNTSASADLIR